MAIYGEINKGVYLKNWITIYFLEFNNTKLVSMKLHRIRFQKPLTKDNL
jgi:hypothetical protein